LENVIERAVTLTQGERVTTEDLPAGIREVKGERQLIEDGIERLLPLEELERGYIKRMLEKTGGNKYRAAQILGIDRKTLYRKLGEMEKAQS
jgi:DNA-binding NtrC family response regulator